ncbi:hypothetical protein HHUSO_G36830 [Huso huso]|uniref:Uncharacterized protein n=1 Tax=Huso huso TaxID=61971 RepID=A0ABR0Y0B8_HUSHU
MEAAQTYRYALRKERKKTRKRREWRDYWQQPPCAERRVQFPVFLHPARGWKERFRDCLSRTSWVSEHLPPPPPKGIPCRLDWDSAQD